MIMFLLSPLPMSSPQLMFPSAFQAGLNPSSRLSNLLAMKDSVSNIKLKLKHHPSSSSSSSSSLSSPSLPSLSLSNVKDDDALRMFRESADDDEETSLGGNSNRQHHRLGKRIFCNVYTGCGGDFRRRRGQQPRRRSTKRGSNFNAFVRQPSISSFSSSSSSQSRGAEGDLSAAEKRIFCNTFGCANSVKRTLALEATPPEMMLPSFERIVLPVEVGTGPRRMVGDLNDNDNVGDDSGDDVDNDNNDNANSASLVKRLFCNHFGGCRNSGKRTSSALPVLIRKRSDLRHLSPGQTISLWERLSHSSLGNDGGRQEKRFFAGGFDNSMDDFVNSMRR